MNFIHANQVFLKLLMKWCSTMDKRYVKDENGNFRKVKAIYVGENGKAIKIWEDGVVLDNVKWIRFRETEKIRDTFLVTLLKILRGER